MQVELLEILWVKSLEIRLENNWENSKVNWMEQNDTRVWVNLVFVLLNSTPSSCLIWRLQPMILEKHWEPMQGSKW